MNNRPILPYIVIAGFSTVLVTALMEGYDRSGMHGVMVAAALAYIPLGFIIYRLSSPNLTAGTLLAGLATLLFMLRLHEWNIGAFLAATEQGIPHALEPLAVSVFFLVGGWLGHRLRSLSKGPKKIKSLPL